LGFSGRMLIFLMLLTLKLVLSCVWLSSFSQCSRQMLFLLTKPKGH